MAPHNKNIVVQHSQDDSVYNAGKVDIGRVEGIGIEKMRRIFKLDTCPIIILFLALSIVGCEAFIEPEVGVLPPENAALTAAAETMIAGAQATERAILTSPGLIPTPSPGEATSLPPHPGTPDPTPIPVLEVIFYDDFETEEQWDTVSEEQYRMFYHEGGYRIAIDFMSSHVSSVFWLDYGDIRVEVDAARAAGPETGYYGVVCRWQDSNNYYALVIGNDGFYGIARIQEGEITFLEEGMAPNSVNNPASGASRIGGSCFGRTLSLEVNDQMLVETEDSTFPSGFVGLMAGTRASPGIEVHFDNFTLLTVELFPALPTPTPLNTDIPSPTEADHLTPTPLATPFTTSTPIATPALAPTPPDVPAPVPSVLDTPTTETTPSSPAELIFLDDFSIPGIWHTEEQLDFRMYYQADGYRIRNTFPNTNVSSIRFFEHIDIRVEVDAARVAGPETGYYGIVCRWQDVHNYYAMIIGSDGYYGIARMQDREMTFLNEGRSIDGPILPGTLPDRISGSCTGNTLALEVNGHKLLEVQDVAFGSGYVGVMVGNRDQGGILVHFDNFALFIPSQSR